MVRAISLRPGKNQSSSNASSSGDVGVRASLVLHGTPPFIVYYTERQNSGQIQNKQKSITGAARAEIILQPESSGTYKYEFTQVSDRKYRQVPLRGPGRSITQVVHPLASADFVRPDVDKRAGLPASKKTVGSCGGKQVTLDVDLRVRIHTFLTEWFRILCQPYPDI